MAGLRMSEPVESIASRELAAWLRSHAEILEGEAAKIRAMAPDADDCTLLRMTDKHLERVRAVVAWLDGAKFEVRDPWRLRVAVRDAIIAYETADDEARGMAFEQAMQNLKEVFQPFKGNL